MAIMEFQLLPQIIHDSPEFDLNASRCASAIQDNIPIDDDCEVSANVWLFGFFVLVLCPIFWSMLTTLNMLLNLIIFTYV